MRAPAAAVSDDQIAVLRRRSDDLVVFRREAGVLEAHLELLGGDGRVADGRRGVRLDQLAEDRVAELVVVGARRLLRERRRAR